MATLNEPRAMWVTTGIAAWVRSVRTEIEDSGPARETREKPATATIDDK
jgi:hypothetical protein